MNIVDKKLIYAFRKDSEKLGLQKASKILLKKLGIRKINIKGKLPQKGGVLLVSNHPGGLDSFIIPSVIKRNDIFKVILYVYKIMGKVASKKLIPIYRINKIGDEILYFLLQKDSPRIQNLDVSKVQELNRKSITKAASLVSKGNIVMMFPQGQTGKSITETGWKAGIGFLVKQIKNEKTQIVFAEITGTDRNDILRYIKKPTRSIFFPEKEVYLKFSKPVNITKIKNRTQKSGKELTLTVEKMYYKLWKSNCL